MPLLSDINDSSFAAYLEAPDPQLNTRLRQTRPSQLHRKQATIFHYTLSPTVMRPSAHFLVECMMKSDPKRRYTTAQVRSHPWFTQTRAVGGRGRGVSVNGDGGRSGDDSGGGSSSQSCSSRNGSTSPCTSSSGTSSTSISSRASTCSSSSGRDSVYFSTDEEGSVSSQRGTSSGCRSGLNEPGHPQQSLQHIRL